MGFRFDDASRDSLAPRRLPPAELLDSEGPQAGSFSRSSDPAGPRALRPRPRSSWAAGPPTRTAIPTPPACSWRTTSRSAAGARKPACRITRRDSRSRDRRSRGSWRRRRSIARWAGRARARPSPSACPRWATRSSASACCQPLGEGAFARVFLAEQADLAGRPVVLKICDIEGDRAADPRPVAAHQHRPDLFAPRGSAPRACAPSACPTWAGRASRRSWPQLWADSPRPTSGESFVRALEAVEAPRPGAIRERATRGA